MWKRLASALLEGVVRELGSRAAVELEQWLEARRELAQRACCATCARPLACPTHGTLGVVPLEDEAS